MKSLFAFNNNISFSNCHSICLIYNSLYQIKPNSSYNQAFFYNIRQSSNIHTKSNQIIGIENLKGPSSLATATDFIEWFRGFTDAEGCFHIRKNKGNSFEFRFSIGLHIDDVKVLEYIYNNLLIGKVKINTKENIATYNIIAKDEIAIIVNLFTIFSLNSTKHLNFLVFQKAFQLYLNWGSEDRDELVREIEELRLNMNSKRLDFVMPDEHKVTITPYWLLGFIEGDGSFSVKNSGKDVNFSISQKGNKDLLIAISRYLESYVWDNEINNLIKEKPELVLLKESKNFTTELKNCIYVGDSQGITCLSISNPFYLNVIIVPLLDKLSWNSKKYLDYCDWKLILVIISKGLHYTLEGLNIIEIISNQMNNNRLSTTTPEVKITSYKDKIYELLNSPSNYEIRNGKLFIISLNRFRVDKEAVSIELVDSDTLVVIESFTSISDCAKYLNIARSTVNNRALKGKIFKFEDRLVYIKSSI
uniref:Double-motif LAGLIDADG homing endonuclease n=1 Tax=Ophiostoma novo-ulmi subsp. novo-ulmi TaxID=170179 RepID=A0A2L1IPX2_OPHNO|nr:double-motif LAGLIDADG homing endonuclease [Ophiostoma novo-ulmi subsp. novo-ulmi]